MCINNMPLINECFMNNESFVNKCSINGGNSNCNNKITKKVIKNVAIKTSILIFLKVGK